MRKKILSGILAAVLAMSLLSACGRFTARADGEEPSVLGSDAAVTEETIAIVLRDGGSRCESPGVEISGDTVAITAAGDYVLSGSLSDGQILVNAPDDAKVKLILNGVSIVKNGHAAIYALSADRLVLSTAEGSENLLQSAGDFVQIDENNVDAAVFAKCDLTLSGDGVLNISSLTGHAVVSKDDLKLKSGTVNLEAASKGLCGKDSVVVEGGVLNADVGTDGIYAGKSEDSGKGTIRIDSGVLNLLCQKEGLDASGDIRITGGELVVNAGSGQEGMGIQSDANIIIDGGSVTVTSVDDAIHASGSVTLSGADLQLSTGDDGVHADDTLTVSGGSLSVLRSYEGLEAQVIKVSGGDIRVNASDDGLNAAGGNDNSNSMGVFGGDPFVTDSDASLTISGGTVHINAEGDGLDSNGYLYMSGGSVFISGPTNGGNGAIDYGIDASISGGTIVAAGAAGMAENFGQNSSQASMLVNFSSTQAAGSTIYLLDKTGGILVSYTPEKSYSSVVISTSGLSVGESYTVVAETEEAAVTLDSLIYGSGGMMGGFGPMGGPGGGFDGQSRPDGFPQGNFGPMPRPDGNSFNGNASWPTPDSAPEGGTEQN